MNIKYSFIKTIVKLSFKENYSTVITFFFPGSVNVLPTNRNTVTIRISLLRMISTSNKRFVTRTVLFWCLVTYAIHLH